MTHYFTGLTEEEAIQKGKDFGYVILPVFTKSKYKEEVIESKEFKEILSTLRALASNDERIVEEFRDISKNGKSTSSNSRLIQFDIDENNGIVKFELPQFKRKINNLDDKESSTEIPEDDYSNEDDPDIYRTAYDAFTRPDDEYTWVTVH